MKYKMNWIVFTLAVTLIISGCAAEVPTVVEVDQQVPIELASMKKDMVTHTYLSVGEVVPNKLVELFIPGTGVIEKVNVKTGDWVEKGVLLAQLDGVDVDMSGYNATESQLRTVRDNISNQLATLSDTYDRQEILYNNGIITKVEFEQTQNQIQSLEGEYANAKVAYSNQLASIRDGFKDTAEQRLLESSVSGLVAGVYVKEGQAAFNQLALTIIADSKLFVKTYVSSDLKKSLALGDDTIIKVDGEEKQAQKGTIYEIETLPNQTSKLFEVLIEVSQPEALIIGDYAEVEFIVERYEAILVPTQAVIRRGTEQFVYTYRDGQLEELQIEAGRTSGNWLEIKNVDEIYDVVVKGQNQLSGGGEPVVVD